MISKKDFSRIVKEIENTGYKLAISKPQNAQFYLLNGRKMSSLLIEALTRRFAGMDCDEIEVACMPLIAILEGPLVMLQYIENKIERDHLLQKKLSPEAQKLLRNSITRTSNIGNILSGLQILPEEFPEFTNPITQLRSNQAKSSDDEQKITTAKNVRDLVYKFCIGIIQFRPY